KKTYEIVNVNGIVIDGTTQATAVGNTNLAGPEVFFDVVDLDVVPPAPNKLFFSSHCFVFAAAANNTLSGFGFVDSSPGATKSTGGVIGLVANTELPIFPTKGNKISDNWFGLSPDGEIYSGLRFGIYLAFNSQENVVEKNVICTEGFDLQIDFFLNGLTASRFLPTRKNIVRENYLGTNSKGTRRLTPVAFNRKADGLGNPSLGISYSTTENTIENNIIAGTKSGGIGAINPGEGNLISGANANIIRNNRIGIGVNGENIGPDLTVAENARAVGIFASAGDTVTGNQIGNFPGAGLEVQTAQKPDSANPFGPTVVTGNTISNCGIGIQATQIRGAVIAGNTISNYSKGGVVLGDRPFDASTGSSQESVNPWGIPTVNVTMSENQFTNVSGPGIALTPEVGDVVGGGYLPNTRTVVDRSGPNFYQPSAVLRTAQRQADGSILVTGFAPNPGKIELYASNRPARPTAPDTDPAAYGLGRYMVRVDDALGEFTTLIPASTAQGITDVSATLTVPTSTGAQTSEFSRTIAVQGIAPPPDTVAPTVMVTAPTAGQQIESKAGTQVVIGWQSSDNVGVVRHDVWLARPGPGAVDMIASGLAGSAQSFTRNVPENLDVPQAQIVVMAFDAAGNQGQGLSGMFTVKKPVVGPPPDTEKPVVTNVTLAAGLTRTAQSFAWTVPGTVAKTKTGVVKVVARDAAGNTGEAVSNPFVIK
ncbi:MAG: right-handed parallel beta-helix repeat-containing protein, partial [Blastocatellia bacterium]|nr:right-handed parallel beta-helix repeat-containing protein [Blastocatellia bacterium]